MMRLHINPHVIFFLGILPDIDLFLSRYGIAHRTITHSMIFWVIAFIPVFIRYRKASIPYLIAAVQHIIFGDFVVSHATPFWPLTDYRWGLDLPLSSVENVIVEAVGLIILLVWASLGNREIFSMRRGNILSVLVIAPLISFLIFVYQGGIYSIAEHGLAADVERSARTFSTSDLLPHVLVLHLLLVSFLSISLVQGLRAVRIASDKAVALR
jgi:membrane-bound metal-dependent hydrolase YbcI (DUF457 family)